MIERRPKARAPDDGVDTDFGLVISDYACSSESREWPHTIHDPALARFTDRNGEIFYTLKEAQMVIESWRRHYNTVRPHSSLGYKPPAPEAVLWPAAQPQPAPPATPTVAPRPIMH